MAFVTPLAAPIPYTVEPLKLFAVTPNELSFSCHVLARITIG